MALISARRKLCFLLRFPPLEPVISLLSPVSFLWTLPRNVVTFVRDDILSFVCLRAGLRLWVVDILAKEERLSLVNLLFLSENEEKLLVVVIFGVFVFLRN